MDEIQRIKNELAKMRERRVQNLKGFKQSTALDDFPTPDRTFTYRKSIIIKAHDLYL